VIGEAIGHRKKIITKYIK